LRKSVPLPASAGRVSQVTDLAVVLVHAHRIIGKTGPSDLIENSLGLLAVILASSGSEGGYANSAVVEFLKKMAAGVELGHFGDSAPKGFDILRDLRVRVEKPVRSLHMQFRATDPSGVLSPEDHATIDRLLLSEHLTDTEKDELQKLKAAASKRAFEQENLGRPKANWPFY
jgi:hypothetical protein